MSKVDGSMVATPSYGERHFPPVSAQPVPTCGRVVASWMRTSSRVSHPSWSASVQSVNFARSYPAVCSEAVTSWLSMVLVDIVDVVADAGTAACATARADTTAAAAKMQARSRQMMFMDSPPGCRPGLLLAGDAVLVAVQALVEPVSRQAHVGGVP